MPGWKTDMGMIYILFGPPDDLEIYNDPLSRIYSQRWHYYRINKYFDFIDENLDILFEAIVNYGTSADKKVLNKIVDSEYSAV